MNDPGTRRDRMVGELFHDDWTDGPAAHFAAQAAAHARRRRHARRLLGGVSALAGLAAIALFLPRTDAPKAVTFQTASRPTYEIISDDELLATLTDRPLLAVRVETGKTTLSLLPN